MGLVENIALKFVDLVLKYEKWDKVKELPENELQILHYIVLVAGFNPKKVVPGKLTGHYRNQDGSRTGETYPINCLCPFKVINQEDGDHYFATGWLDCSFRRVAWGAARLKISREKLIETIIKEIKRSIPLIPIQLTPEGDLLQEYPPSMLAFGLTYFVDHAKDDHQLNYCVGVHKHCNGWMDRVRATETHDAICCRNCHLRVLFPKEVRTYGELRQALASQSIQAIA